MIQARHFRVVPGNFSGLSKMVSFLFHNNEQLCKSGLSFLPHGDSLPENKVNPEESKLRYNISENIWTLHLMSDLSMYRQDITTNDFFFFFAYSTWSWSYLFSLCACCMEDFPKQTAKIRSHCWTWTVYPSRLSDGKAHGAGTGHCSWNMQLSAALCKRYGRESMNASTDRHPDTTALTSIFTHLLYPTLPLNSFSKI